MLHVVIADDEDRICRLINVLAHWSQYGMQLDGMAQNGSEALALIRKYNADVLITDIRMPGISGLSLIEQARGISKKIRFIIISGYADFAYAQDAIRLGVSDYLLKPVNEQALNDTLKKIASEIGEKQEQEEAYRSAILETVESRDKVRSSLIHDLNSKAAEEYSVLLLRTRYGIEAGRGRLRAFCIKADEKPEENAESIRTNAWDTARRILHSELDPLVYDLILSEDKDDFYGVMQIRNGEDEAIEAALRRALNSLQGRNDVLGRWNFSMGGGPSADAPSGLPETFRLARLAVQNRLLSGCGRLYLLRDDKAVLPSERMLISFSEKIEAAIRERDEEKAKQAVRDLLHESITFRNVQGWEYIQLCSGAAKLSENRLGLSVSEKIRTEFSFGISNSESVDGLFNSLLGFYIELIHAIDRGEKELDEQPVRTAQNYIRDHYAEQLTLEEVSSIVELAPNYFSGLFKKVTGDGFAHYLIGVRMDAAKKYLQETRMPISEIAGRVGYNDVKYFTKTFIKLNGVKPTVFRKLYGGYS